MTKKMIVSVKMDITIPRKCVSDLPKVISDSLLWSLITMHI